MLLTQDIYLIGRASRCNIRLASQFVSRYHATLIKKNYADHSYDYEILDGTLRGQPSKNGLLVNGQKIRRYTNSDRHTLCPEDVVIFGPGVQATYYKDEKAYGDQWWEERVFGLTHFAHATSGLYSGLSSPPVILL